MVKKLIDIQGIKSNKQIALVGIQFEYTDHTNFRFISLGVGTRRELLRQFSLLTNPNTSMPTDIMRWDGSHYTGDEILQLVDRTCAHAIPLEEFMRKNSCSGIHCLSIGKDRHGIWQMIQTNTDMDAWMQRMHEQIKAGDNVQTGFIPADIDRFAHDDKRADMKYLIRNRSRYVRKEGDTLYSCSFDQADKMTWDDAVRIVAMLPNYTMIPYTGETVAYVIRYTAGEYAGEYVEARGRKFTYVTSDPKKAHKYTTRTAAENATKHIREQNMPIVEEIILEGWGSEK